MKEEIKIIDGTFKKDDPHKDIGKQKFRVRRAYTTWVEYDVVADSKEEAEDAVREHGGIDKIEWQEGYHNDEPVEVYAQDYNPDTTESFDAVKVAECVPYEDSDGIYYDDPTWETQEYMWQIEEDQKPTETKKEDMEVPF